MQIGGDRACTNGKTIQLPALPLEMDETTFALVRGYLDHESAHLRETDFAALKAARLSPLEHHIWNILEDWRVEQKLSAVFPGCRGNLTWLIRRLFIEKETMESEPDEPVSLIATWLLLSVRSWVVPELQRQVDTLACKLDTYAPGLLTELDTLLGEAPARCGSTQGCITLAKEMAALIKAHVPAETASDNSSRSTPGSFPKDLGAILSESLTGLHSQGGEQICVAVPTKKSLLPLTDQQLNTARQTTTALRIRLQALLQSRSLKRSAGGFTGKLDTTRLYRLATGNARLFKKRTEHTALDTAVHILLDASGSMSGKSMELACLSSYALASSLSNVPGLGVAVTTFPGIPLQEDGSTPQSWQTVCPILRHKETMHTRFNLPATGSTPLGAALWWVYQQLLPLAENRNIILLITDGEPDDEETAHTAIKAGTSLGFEIHGIGIGTTSLQKLLPAKSFRTIDALTDLAPAMFHLLQKSLLSQ